jgi:choline dehydrogenase
MPNTHDFIVVGAGASGCIVANRLSAHPGYRVLLLEAGGGLHERPEVTIPKNVTQAWFKPEFDWGYVTEPQPGLNGRTIPILRGKGLGGSTCLHALMFVRGNCRDFDTWGFLGCDGWDYGSILPYFRRLEDWERGDSRWRGTGGPISVRINPTPTEFALRFLDACGGLGYDTRSDADYNGEKQENSPALFQLTLTKDGKRASAAQAYLGRSVLGRPNLTVSTGSMVRRIALEKGRCVGVEYVKDEQTMVAHADREVILCGGAFDSPRLLLLSGLGPADHLRSVGVSPVVHLPGVGQNLIDHMLMPFPYHSNRKLPVPDFLAEAGIFLKTRPGMEAATPNLQVNVNAGVPQLAPPTIGDFFQFVIIVAQPQSKGEVRLRSADPTQLPSVNPNYLQCRADYDTLRSGIEFARHVVQTRAVGELNGGCIPFPDDGPENQIEAFIRNTAQTVWHPVGTCKMGRDALAVVEPDLRVRGVAGLRVADASIMPTIISGNPVAAIHMIGEKASDLILRA